MAYNFCVVLPGKIDKRLGQFKRACSKLILSVWHCIRSLVVVQEIMMQSHSLSFMSSCSHACIHSFIHAFRPPFCPSIHSCLPSITPTIRSINTQHPFQQDCTVFNSKSNIYNPLLQSLIVIKDLVRLIGFGLPQMLKFIFHFGRRNVTDLGKDGDGRGQSNSKTGQHQKGCHGHGQSGMFRDKGFQRPHTDQEGWQEIDGGLQDGPRESGRVDAPGGGNLTGFSFQDDRTVRIQEGNARINFCRVQPC